MRQNRSQLFFRYLHQARGPGDDLSARGCRCAPPLMKCFAGRFDRGPRFFAGCLSICADDFSRVGGIDIVNGLCRRGFDPFAADKISIGIHRLDYCFAREYSMKAETNQVATRLRSILMISWLFLLRGLNWRRCGLSPELKSSPDNHLED